MKYGRAVVLEVVSLVNVPGFVLRPTENCFALLIPVTANVPLNPILLAAVVFVELLTFTSSTTEPTERLCGSSVAIFAVLADQSAPAINLKFLC